MVAPRKCCSPFLAEESVMTKAALAECRRLFRLI